MSPSLDPSNFSALEYNNSVAESVLALCNPLFSNFGITMFGYAHFLNDGTYLDLSTDTKWQSHYIEHFAASPFIGQYIKDIYKNRVKYALWNNSPNAVPDKIFKKFIVDSCGFDIWHGFTIYKYYEESIEAWHFATTKDNYKITSFYINYIHLLEHFILYFRDRASAIIDVSDASRLVVLKNRSLLDDVSSEFYKKEADNKIKEFIEGTHVKKYHLNVKGATVHLSPREVECMVHLSESKSTKEIASLMDLSPRTIETHVENVKRKLGCDRRSKLIETFSESFRRSYL
jgi:DNA-binding CsgD family transcriptional regulator